MIVTIYSTLYKQAPIHYWIDKIQSNPLSITDKYTIAATTSNKLLLFLFKVTTLPHAGYITRNPVKPAVWDPRENSNTHTTMSFDKAVTVGPRKHLTTQTEISPIPVATSRETRRVPPSVWGGVAALDLEKCSAIHPSVVSTATISHRCAKQYTYCY